MIKDTAWLPSQPSPTPFSDLNSRRILVDRNVKQRSHWRKRILAFYRYLNAVTHQISKDKQIFVRLTNQFLLETDLKSTSCEVPDNYTKRTYNKRNLFALRPFNPIKEELSQTRILFCIFRNQRYRQIKLKGEVFSQQNQVDTFLQK